MLKRIYIDNFKSLVDFELPRKDESALGKFICLVGLNGAGKSTVLQAIDFLGHLAAGDVSAWLKSREWEAADLRTKKSGKSLIRFQVDLETPFGPLTWGGGYNVTERRCTSERLNFQATNEHARSGNVNFESGVLSLSDGSKVPVVTEHEGSVLSGLKVDLLPTNDRFAAFLLRYYMSGIKSLELLSPHLMRRPSRDAVDVGAGGEKLAAFIKGLSKDEREKLFIKLSEFYPRLKRIQSKSVQFGWKRLFVTEGSADSFEIEARHVNDGLLRLAAVIAQTVAEGGAAKFRKSLELGEKNKEELGELNHRRYQYILLDEIENGINPESIQRLVSYLQSVPQQVFVTTHSPLVLNYLTDDEARNSVFFAYRDSTGGVKTRRLFEVKELAQKLDFMGPGEAYADTGLEKLSLALASE
jgi:predicted ATPase